MLHNMRNHPRRRLMFMEGFPIFPNSAALMAQLNDCATLRPLCMTTPHIMEQSFFLQRNSSFKIEIS